MMIAHGRGCGPQVQEGPEFLKAGGHSGAKVLLVDGEMIVSDIQERAKGLMSGLGVPMDALENVTVYAKTAQDYRADFVDLAKAEWRAQIINEVQAKGFEVVILDNLRPCSRRLRMRIARIAGCR
jgi:hypothetical protein